MPYQLLSAKAYDLRLDDQWVSVDLALADINTTLAQYSKVYLELSHTTLPDPVWLDLEAARVQIPIYIGTRTFTQWLTDLGNASLPTQTTTPDFAEHPARYRDALHAGYKTRPFKIGVNPEVVLPMTERRDLLLTKDGVDFNQYWKYLLVTVNGRFHRVGNGGDSLHVVDGAYSGCLHNDTNVGIYSFREVGELQIVPITPDMLYKNDVEQHWADRVNLRLPTPVEDRTPLLVLGGYLHPLDESYWVTGSHTLAVDMRRIPWIDRIYESRDRIDLSSLQLDAGPGNERQYALSQLEEDRVIQSYFTLSQSFIVLVNTKHLYKRHHNVERTELPGRYISHLSDSRLPLIGPLGAVHDYVHQPDWGVTVLAANNVLEHEYIRNTSDWFNALGVDDSRYSSRPFRYANPQLLELGRYA